MYSACLCAPPPLLQPSVSLGPPAGLLNISRFLSATTSKGPFDNMHRQMLLTRGKLLVEMIEALSGKAMPGKVGKTPKAPDPIP